MIAKYKDELEQQLRDTTDTAVGLLLSLLILIAREESIAVHASGKFVSFLIAKVGYLTFFEMYGITCSMILLIFYNRD